MSVLTVADLTVKRGPCPVVEGLSFSAGAGQVTALVGPNGAGKSTVIKAILGLLPIAHGTITWADRDLTVMAPRDRARLVAYVPQHSRLTAGMNVINVVAMGRFAHQGALARLAASDQAAIDAALVECAEADLQGVTV